MSVLFFVLSLPWFLSTSLPWMNMIYISFLWTVDELHLLNHRFSFYFIKICFCGSGLAHLVMHFAKILIGSGGAET